MATALKALFLVFFLMVLAPLVVGSFVEKYSDWRDVE